MKKKLTKPLALVMSLVLFIGCMGGVLVHALTKDTTQTPETEQTSAETPETASAEAKTTSTDDTVYVLAGANGSARKVIVSDAIRDALAGDVDAAAAAQSNISMADGDGNAIAYAGSIGDELPVDMTISYKLDGKTVTPEALAGKSGKVSIRFDYKNKQYQTVEIDGKQEKLSVPIVMLSGLLLDNEQFTNIEVSNGKLLNDGTRTAVIGVAFPGLQDDLKVDRQKLTLPEYVEITADVTDFSLGNTLSVATSEPFRELDLSKVGSVSELTQELSKLNDAMAQLLDGSAQLYDGLCTLLEKSGELVNGIDSLAAGSAELVGGAKRLTSGLDTLCAKSDTLNGGAKQVFEALLSTADAQIAASGLSASKLTMENYADVLNGILSSLDANQLSAQAQSASRAQVTALVNAQRPTITAAVTAAVRQEVTAQVTATVNDSIRTTALSAAGMTPEEYQAAIEAGVLAAEQQAEIEAAITAQQQSEAALAQIQTLVDAQMAAPEIQSTISAKTDAQIAALIEQNMSSSDVQSQIAAGLAQAAAGRTAITSLKEQLDSYKSFYEGLGAYTAGVASADTGAKQLANGLGRLNSGLQQLHLSAPALVNGVTPLRDGSLKLSDGLKAFNEEGVQKLTEAVEGELQGLLDRLNAVVSAAKSYSGLSEAQAQYIYRTDSIG